MAEYLSEFVTNLAMPPAVRPVPHQFAMGDNNAYTFTALLCDARNPDAELMAGTVSGSLLRPDGTTVALGGTKGAAVRRVNLDGGGMCNATPCSVTLPQACFAYPGRVTLVITLVDGTTITQALAVSAVVARTSTDAVVDPGDLVPDVAELQAIATELTAAVGGAVRFDEAQTLTDAQKAQARANIGAGEGGGGTVTGAVRYDTAQTLTDAEKTQAQTNIGAAAVSAITSLSADITALENNKAVRYDTTQFLTDAQKTQARTNVGAAGAAETTEAIQTEAAARDQAIADKAVRYDTAQTLTEAQKAQARENINTESATNTRNRDRLISYRGPIYQAEETPGDTSAKGIGVNAVGETIGITGTNNSTGYIYIKLSGDGARTASSTTVKEWTGELTIPAGRTIRTTLCLLSGSVTESASGGVSVSLYKSGTSSTVGTAIRRGSVFQRIWTSDGDAVTVTLLVAKNVVVSNAVYSLTIEDITEGDLDAYTIPVAGATPSITAVPGTAYNCTAAYVETLSFTPSDTGICSVRFVSGTTATVLTLPGSVKMPDWFDPLHLEASRTYEISIADGVYGVVTSWA